MIFGYVNKGFSEKEKSLCKNNLAKKEQVYHKKKKYRRAFARRYA